MNVTEQLKQKVSAMLTRKPRTISLELTTYCPLQCKYCKRNEIVGGKKDKKLDWDKFLKLKDRLNEFDRIVICGLGETMAYSNIYDVLEHLDQRITLITSGTVAIDYKRLNRKKNLETVVFSLDAPTEEEMLDITGNYNWGNLMSNFQRNRYNRSVLFSVNCTVFESNYKRIPDLTRFAIFHKMKNINFNNAMQEADNIELRENIMQTLEEAEAIARKNNLTFTHSFMRLSCVAFGVPIPFITLNGDVFTCCYGVEQGAKVGNIYESSFNDMWNSNTYDRFTGGDLCFKEGCPLFKDLSMGCKNGLSKLALF